MAIVLPKGAHLRGGRYQIEDALGKGGFGITYRAVDTRFKRTVAIKEFFPSGHASRDTISGKISVDSFADKESVKAGLEGFQREGEHLAQISHPHIPTIHDIFEENNTAYLVMEFISGQTLKAKMNGRPLPQSEVRRIMNDLVSALAAVHAQKVYHLDIKPANVMIDAAEKAFLIDFGAARQGSTFNTNSIAFLTPQYAPWELITSEPYGSYTDIYEIGVMLHEMLTGKLPPMAQARLVSPRDAAWHPTALSEPWYAVLVDALKMEPSERPTDIRAWWSKATVPVAPPIEPEPIKPVAVPPEIDTPRPPPPVVIPPSKPKGELETTKPLPPQKSETSRRNPNPYIAVGGGTIIVAGILIALNIPSVSPRPGNTPTPNISPTTTAKPPATPDPQEKRREATARLKNALDDIAAKRLTDAEVIKAIRAAVEAGADLTTVNGDKATALHIAATLGDHSLAKLLLQHGADVTAQNKHNSTPLHLAVIADSPDLVQLLLEYRADRDTGDFMHNTPLDFAQSFEGNSSYPNAAKIVHLLNTPPKLTVPR